MGDFSYFLEKLQFEESLKVKAKHFRYKYLGGNSFLMNKNEEFYSEDADLISQVDNIRFLTIFALNNNLSSFYQVILWIFKFIQRNLFIFYYLFWSQLRYLYWYILALLYFKQKRNIIVNIFWYFYKYKDNVFWFFEVLAKPRYAQVH